MNPTFKKIISLLLACLMAFSVTTVAFAASQPDGPITVTGRGETYNHYPQVMVKGFGASCVNIYYEDDPEQKPLFYPIDEERLKGNLDNIGDYVLKSIENREFNVLRTIIYSYVMDSIGMLALNPDGSNMEGVTTDPVGLKYRGNGKYDFYYDCRFSPADSCDDLYNCINEVFEETNAEKIELVGSSFGRTRLVNVSLS